MKSQFCSILFYLPVKMVNVIYEWNDFLNVNPFSIETEIILNIILQKLLCNGLPAMKKANLVW